MDDSGINTLGSMGMELLKNYKRNWWLATGTTIINALTTHRIFTFIL